MAQPVWVLSVDLQTKTATFQSGMAEAARSARESFTEIKSGASEMGRATSGSMMEARHGVMLLGEEFGVHLPRALTTFIASIGPVGAAMEAAFPFLAIIVGATLLLEHLSKLKQAGETLTESQTKFGTVAANVLNEWNDKILQAGIETDKLNNNHLDALNKTLKLIDHQSMKELVQSFDTVAKAADGTFAELKTHWYQWDAGSAGAKASLESFKVQYDALLAKQDSKGGTALLDAKIEREQRILTLQQQAQNNQTRTGTGGMHQGDYNKFEEAKIALQKMGVGYSEDEVKAQVVQVGALKDLVDLEAKRADLVKAQSTNAQKTEQNRGEGDQDKVAREQAQSAKQAQEEAEKLWEENYRRAVAALQENERAKIDATKEGSAARLAAIDAAIKEEESKGLQDNGFYRGLLTSRVELTRQMADEQAKLTADAGKEAAEHAEKMGELQVEADKNAAQLRMSAHRVTDAERVAAEQQTADAEYRVQLQALQKEAAALDQSSKEYANKLKAIQDKEVELTQAHENKLTEIKEKAEEQRNARILSAEQRANDAIGRSFAEMVTRHERAGKMLIGLGDQVAAGILQNALKMILADDMTKGHDAAAAARKAFLAGENALPGIPGVILGGVLAAGAFAKVMAFETGGIVPGVGMGDTVPAMLTPGEAVLPKNLTDNLRSAARSGNLGGGGGEVHLHVHQTNHIHAMDSEGVERVLNEHKDTFAKHFNDHVRKQNG